MRHEHRFGFAYGFLVANALIADFALFWLIGRHGGTPLFLARILCLLLTWMICAVGVWLVKASGMIRFRICLIACVVSSVLLMTDGIVLPVFMNGFKNAVLSYTTTQELDALPKLLLGPEPERATRRIPASELPVSLRTLVSTRRGTTLDMGAMRGETAPLKIVFRDVRFSYGIHIGARSGHDNGWEIYRQLSPSSYLYMYIRR